MQKKIYALNKQIIITMILITNSFGFQKELGDGINRLDEQIRKTSHLSLTSAEEPLARRNPRADYKKSNYRKTATTLDLENYVNNEKGYKKDPRRSWRDSIYLKSTDSLVTTPKMRRSLVLNPDTGVTRISLSSGLVPNTYGLEDLIFSLSDLEKKVKESNNSDIIDIFMTAKADGKTESYSVLKLAGEFNDMLVTPKPVEEICELELYSVVDTFVGEGGGAILATLAALGKISLDDAAKIMKTIPTEPLISKAGRFGKKLVGAAKIVEVSLLSALNQKSDVSAKEPAITTEIVNYDKLDFQEQGGKSLSTFFGNLTVHDLKSSLQLLDAPREESLAAWVGAAISKRDKNIKSRNRYLTIEQAMDTAVGIMSSTSKLDDKLGAVSEKIPEDLINELKQMETGLIKKKEKDLSVTDLINSIANRREIKRDIIIVSIKADKTENQSVVLNFGYDIKKVNEGKSIIVIKYKIGIPKYFYKQSNKEDSVYWEIIDEAIEKINEKGTRIGEATNLLMNLFNVCNERAVEGIAEICNENEEE